MVASTARLVRPLTLLLLLSWPLCGRSQPVNQPFTFSNALHTLPNVHHGSLAMGDFDGDGDLDVFLTGLLDGSPHARLYRFAGVDQDNRFVFEPADTPARDRTFGRAAWADYDGDGDLDLMTTGSLSPDPPYEPATTLLRNDGGAFVEVPADLVDVHSGPVAWADFDGDGDLDVLIGGEDADGNSVARLYRNAGGTFTAVQALPGLAYGDAKWGDLDGDGDLDLAAAGAGADGFHADVYVNQEGSLEATEAGLTPTAFADLTWADYDADGDLDLLQIGGRLTTEIAEGVTAVYENDGGNFTRAELELPNLFSGNVSFGDYDNDGDLDLHLMGGEDVRGPRLARIYAKEGDGYVEQIRLVGVLFGAAGWSDLEGDGDLDLLATGLPTAGTPLVNLYENRRQVRPLDTAPANLDAAVDGRRATLTWEALAGSGSYNVRVGTHPGGTDVVPPMADPSTGRRLVADRGNAQQRRFLSLRGLPPATYYWSVQGIDHALAASPFAAEQRFTIGSATAADERPEAVPTRTSLQPATPNPASGMVELSYDLRESSEVRLRVYDVLGRQVATLVEAFLPAGEHRVVWNGRSVGSGAYFCVLEAGSVTKSISFVVSR